VTRGNPRERGQAAETLAMNHLCRHGLRLIERNFLCRQGEIDLVMADGRQLVFIEVRQRKSDRFGSAAESITRPKQRRIIAAAHYFLLTNGKWGQNSCRFDVVTISGSQPQQVDWIKDAFQA